MLKDGSKVTVVYFKWNIPLQRYLILLMGIQWDLVLAFKQPWFIFVFQQEDIGALPSDCKDGIKESTVGKIEGKM